MLFMSFDGKVVTEPVHNSVDDTFEIVIPTTGEKSKHLVVVKGDARKDLPRLGDYIQVINATGVGFEGQLAIGIKEKDTIKVVAYDEGVNILKSSSDITKKEGGK